MTHVTLLTLIAKQTGENDMTGFSHYNDQGRAQMVNVSAKEETARTATAQSRVRLSKTLYDAIHAQELKKGDPLSVAQIAGIMAAKKTAEWIQCVTLLQFKAQTYNSLMKKSMTIICF